MRTKRITTIIFDLGNVLLDFDHRIAAARIGALANKSEKEIFDLFFDSKLTRAFEEGAISPGDFFLGVKEVLGLRIEYDEFLPIWNEIFFVSQKNKEVADLARRLKNNYTLAVLSNINVLHLEHIKEKYPIFGAFDRVLASCELKITKPAPDIYKKALEILGTSAECAFYTDDRAELIAEAKKLGLSSFVFTSPEQLRQDLASLGIKI